MIAQLVKEAVEDHIGMTSLSAENIPLGFTLRGDMLAEDFELKDMTADLEQRFNITLSEDEMAAAQTVGDLVKLVEGKVK